jgi:hypothetical protein
MKRASVILLWLLLPGVILLMGQTSPAQSADQKTDAEPSITFTRVWDDFKPQSVTMTVSANGATKYGSSNPKKAGDDVDDYQTEFTMSPARREKLFLDAREANYFDGDFNFKKHPVASTGKKTLTYSDSARHFNTTFDYSENKAVADITNILSGISNTIEHGRKLVFLHRFDKLGLEEELKAMESAAEGHNLAELQIVAPTLENIVADSAVLNIARQRAQRLLAKIASE